MGTRYQSDFLKVEQAHNRKTKFLHKSCCATFVEVMLPSFLTNSGEESAHMRDLDANGRIDEPHVCESTPPGCDPLND